MPRELEEDVGQEGGGGVAAGEENIKELGADAFTVVSLREE